MIPNWKASLKDPKGNALKNGEEVVTLESLAYELLLLNDPQANLSGGAKLKNAKLAQKIVNVVDAEITIDEAQIIRDLVGKYASASAVLAVEELLDPAKCEQAQELPFAELHKLAIAPCTKKPVAHTYFVATETLKLPLINGGYQLAKKDDIVIVGKDHAWPVKKEYFEEHYKIG